MSAGACCHHCQGELPPAAKRCPHCGRDLTANDCSTASRPDQGPSTGDVQTPQGLHPDSSALRETPLAPPPRPDPDAQPPWLPLLRVALGLFVLIVGVLLNLPIHGVDESALLKEWSQDAAQKLRSGVPASWRQPPSRQRTSSAPALTFMLPSLTKNDLRPELAAGIARAVGLDPAQAVAVERAGELIYANDLRSLWRRDRDWLVIEMDVGVS